MPHSSRGKTFTPEEDLQLVRLRGAGFTYAQIEKVLFTRSRRSLETRMHRLEANGDAGRIRESLSPATA